METIKETSFYSCRQTGYGHWRITIRLKNGDYASAVTTDSQEVDILNQDESDYFCKADFDTRRLNCQKRLSNFVKSENGLI